MRSVRLALLVAGLSWCGVALAEPVSLEVMQAQVAYDRRTGQPLVTVKFSEAGRLAFGRLSQENVGRQVDFRVDGQSVMKVYIREAILGGSGQILAASPEQARVMAERLSRPGGRIEVEVVPKP